MAGPRLPNPFGGRSIKEWIGSSPDAKVPAKVKDRVFARHKGLCHISGRKIAAGEAWEVEHVKALSEGGEHRESNLAPALGDPHKAKSKAETKRRAKADATRKKHLGIVEGPKMQGRGFQKTRKSADREAKAAGKIPIPSGMPEIFRRTSK